MKWKKAFIASFAFVALIGIINCMVIEPAFAYKEDKAACQTSDETHCCFICHSGHHQWTSPATTSMAHRLVVSDHLLVLPFDVQIDPPLGSIFHPPTTL